MALSGHCGRISGQMPTRLKSSKHVHQHSGILLTLCPCLRGREGGTEKGKMPFYCISISIAQAPPPTPPHTAVYNNGAPPLRWTAFSVCQPTNYPHQPFSCSQIGDCSLHFTPTKAHCLTPPVGHGPPERHAQTHRSKTTPQTHAIKPTFSLLFVLCYTEINRDKMLKYT